MSIARRGGVDKLVLISGGASNPGAYAGTVNPSAGGGVAAAEGSIYLRYAGGAGENWFKSGAAATAWSRFTSALLNGTISSVADLVALAALSTAGFPNGALAYVQSLDDIYALDQVNPHVANGLSVIAAAGGPGYWLAQMQGRWDDLQGIPAAGNAASALTNEVFRDTALRMLFFRHDQNDSLHFYYQMPHKWRNDTSLYPHLHLVPMADPALAQDAYFSGYYVWSQIGVGTIPALAGWTTFSATLTINPGDIYTHKYLSLATVAPPANAKASSILLMYVIREGTNVLDTYTTSKGSGTPQANLGVLSTDLHYRASSFGTILESAYGG